MIVAWRIDKRKHAGTAFTGEGARIHGGRWNLKGTAIVYLSDSLALAALEKLVHFGRAAPRLSFVAFRVRIPKEIVLTLPRRRLPADWRAEPPSAGTQSLGTDWADGLETAVLKVPSVIVPEEFNYVLNPLHPEFRRVRRDAPAPFTFDPRLWKPSR